MSSVQRMGPKTDQQRRREALKWLSIVRQTKPDTETVVAYELGLADLPVHAVEQAIHDIGNTARGDYEHAWPELGTVRSRAAAILRVEQERAESRRLLDAHVPEPISPEKWEEIKTKFRAVLRRRSM